MKKKTQNNLKIAVITALDELDKNNDKKKLRASLIKEVDRIIYTHLVEKGYSQKRIAKTLGVAHNTVRGKLKRYGLATKTYNPVSAWQNFAED